MSSTSLEQRLNTALDEMNVRSGFGSSLVCTDQGLLMAAAGAAVPSDEVAGLVGLFDDIVRRAERDLSVRRVDEVTLLDPGRGRLIVRPIHDSAAMRLFLVVYAPTNASWRRATTDTARVLRPLFEPLLAEAIR